MNKKLIGLIAVAALAAIAAGAAYVVLGGDDDARREGALTTRSYTTGFVGLELDGVSVGMVRSVGGCDLAAPTVTVSSSVEGTQKQAGAPTYAPCTIRFGAGLKLALYQWITDSLAGKSTPRSVAIVVFDANYKAVNRLQLAETTIRRFAIPALASGNSEQVIFELTLSAGSVKRALPSGTASQTSSKSMLASNFRLSSPGLEKDLLSASAVDSWAFEISQAQSTELKTSAGPAQLGDLTVTVNSPGGPEFDMWLDGLVKGSPTERPITLSLMDSTLKTSLVDVIFSSTGLNGADLLGSSEGSTAPTKRSFSMYVEGASIKFNTAVAG